MAKEKAKQKRPRGKWEPVYYPWDRHLGESEEAYAAFRAYLEERTLYNGRRSMKAVSEKQGKSLNLLYRWSSRYDWQIRAVAYDKFLADKEQTEMLHAYRRSIRDRVAKGTKLQQYGFTELEKRLSDPMLLQGMTDQLLLALMEKGVTIARDALRDNIDLSDRQEMKERGQEPLEVHIRYVDTDERKVDDIELPKDDTDGTIQSGI